MESNNYSVYYTREELEAVRAEAHHEGWKKAFGDIAGAIGIIVVIVCLCVVLP